MLTFHTVGGQGITSGFRDACTLAWRLKIATMPGFRHQDSLFSAWFKERKQQLERSLRSTLENASYVTEANPIKVLFRDMYYFLVQFVPKWKRSIEQGARREGLAQYKFEVGMHFLPDLSGGKLLPQVYCVKLDTRGVWGHVSFTDDVIFSLEKRGLFQVVALVDSIEDVEKAEADACSMEGDSTGLLLPHEVTIVVRDTQGLLNSCGAPGPVAVKRLRHTNVVRLASGAEFASSPLCEKRPAPKFYDHQRFFSEVPGKRFVVVRQDRFIFASCRDVAELRRATTCLRSMFECHTHG